MTVLKDGSTLTTGTSVGDTAPGLLITFNSTHPLAQLGLFAEDLNAAPIWGIQDPGSLSLCGSLVWGDQHRAAHVNTPDAHGVAIGVGFDGSNYTSGGGAARSPACAVFPDGTASGGINLWAGTGVPSASTIGNTAAVGDIYIRRDGAGGTRIYRCTVGGAPGTWVAVA